MNQQLEFPSFMRSDPALSMNNNGWPRESRLDIINRPLSLEESQPLEENEPKESKNKMPQTEMFQIHPHCPRCNTVLTKELTRQQLELMLLKEIEETELCTKCKDQIGK